MFARLQPHASWAVVVVLVLVACAGDGSEGVAPRLTFDVEPGSGTLGTVRLAPVPASDDAARSSDAVSVPILVWTGEVEPGPGCVHPDGLPSVLGRLARGEDEIRFTPRFAFLPTLTYTACADLRELGRNGGEGPLTLSFRGVAPEGEGPEPPRVVSIWPADEEVPENLLRVYVRFSESMMARDVSGHVVLLDADGEVVEDAFVEIPEGLWDARSERLTLFLHPGRIKRGVGPNLALGPPLRTGGTFVLRVGPALRSRAGLAMERPFEHAFRVGLPDRVSPDPARWQIVPPSGPRGPVVVRFDEVLDREQLARFATVESADGDRVEGAVTVGEDGRSWSFVPGGGWEAGAYRLLAGRWIEDLAGNTPARLFDVETFSAQDANEVEEPTSSLDAPLVLEFVAPRALTAGLPGSARPLRAAPLPASWPAGRAAAKPKRPRRAARGRRS